MLRSYSLCFCWTSMGEDNFNWGILSLSTCTCNKKNSTPESNGIRLMAWTWPSNDQTKNAEITFFISETVSTILTLSSFFPTVSLVIYPKRMRSMKLMFIGLHQFPNLLARIKSDKWVLQQMLVFHDFYLEKIWAFLFQCNCWESLLALWLINLRSKRF